MSEREHPQSLLRAPYTAIAQFAYHHKLSQVRVIRWLGKPINDRLLEYLRARLATGFVEIDGRKMYLDAEDRLELSIYRVHEPHLTKLVKDELGEGDIVVDVGAHVGYYTLLFSQLVGDNGRVYAVEADPDNFRLLKKNIQTNGYKNVVLLQGCAAEKTGQITTLPWKDSISGQGYKSDNSIDTTHDFDKYISMDTIRLDDLLINEERIDFIKMDIDGAEYNALDGAANALKKTEKVLTEFYPQGLKQFGIDPINYLELLTISGFYLFEIDQDSRRHSINRSQWEQVIPDAHHDITILALKSN